MAQSVHETVFLPPPQASGGGGGGGGGGGFNRRGKKRGMTASSSGMMGNQVLMAMGMEESSSLEVSGFACRFFEDENLARYVESGACFVPWKGNEHLKIDRYDVRHLLDDLSFLNRKKRGGRKSPVPDDVDEEQLDKERYFDLQLQQQQQEEGAIEPSSYSPEHPPEEESSKRQRMESHRYAAIGFSYDTQQVPDRNMEEAHRVGREGDEEARPPAASSSVEEAFMPAAASTVEEAYVPPIPVPHHLRNRMSELANLQRAVRNHKTQHEDATRALDARVLDLEQAVPGPAAGASSSASSSRQLEERVDHVVAMLGDISAFTELATISQRFELLDTKISQQQQTDHSHNNSSARPYKMPTFRIEKFDDYTHQDPVVWWQGFTTELGIHELFINTKRGCQIWLSHMATIHDVQVSDLHKKVSWADMTKEWKKRFILGKLSSAEGEVTPPSTPPDSSALLAASCTSGEDANVASSRYSYEDDAVYLVPPLDQPLHVQQSIACTVSSPSATDSAPSLQSIAGDSTSWSRLDELDPLTFTDFQWMPVPSTGRLPKPHCNVLMAQLRDYLHTAVPAPLMDDGVEVVNLHEYIAKIDREFKTQRYDDIDAPLLYIRIQIGEATCSAKSQPTQVTLADGHTHKSIDRCIDAVPVYFAPHASEAVSFDILDTKFDMILGMSWLRSEDHPVNFFNRTVHIRDRNGVLVPCTVPLPHPSINCHVVSAASMRASIIRDDIEEMGVCFLHALPPRDASSTDSSSDPRITELLDAYSDVFEGPHGVVPDRPIRHEIILEDGAVPPRGCIYRMSEEELSVLRAQLDDLLEKGWIRPSSSPYGAPVLFVRKKNKDLRLCIDHRKLDAQTIRNAGPLPRIDDLLERLGGAQFFSKLDLKSGYHQLEIRKEDRYKTAFKTRYGHFEWLVMSFGLTNAPATFQAAMTTEFRHMLDRFVLIYLDDILVYSRSLDEHVEHLRTVLERLRQAKYKANRDKCEFAHQELEYLGHYVTPQGIRPLANKIEALRVWPEPTNTTDVRSFMGLAGYYQRFITGYSKIAAPMTRLQSPKVPFVFDDAARRSFQALKTGMLMAPVLSIYDPTLPTRVTTDIPAMALGQSWNSTTAMTGTILLAMEKKRTKRAGRLGERGGGGGGNGGGIRGYVRLGEQPGQAEIVLRVKHADNPNFGFLLPNHHLHPYFRYLVEIEKGGINPEKRPARDRAQSSVVAAQSRGSGRGGGSAMSLLGATYGEDEDEDSDTSSASEEEHMELQHTEVGLSVGKEIKENSMDDYGIERSHGGNMEEEEQERKGRKEGEEISVRGEEAKAAGKMEGGELDDKLEAKGDDRRNICNRLAKVTEEGGNQHKGRERKHYELEQLEGLADKERVEAERRLSEVKARCTDARGQDMGSEEERGMVRENAAAIYPKDEVRAGSVPVAGKVVEASITLRHAPDLVSKRTGAHQERRTEVVAQGKDGGVSPTCSVVVRGAGAEHRTVAVEASHSGGAEASGERGGEGNSRLTNEAAVSTVSLADGAHVGSSANKANGCDVVPLKPHLVERSSKSAGSRAAAHESTMAGAECVADVVTQEEAGVERDEPYLAVIPPPELVRRIIEKMVEYIARNGKEFEAIIRDRDREDGRFPFLVQGNEYHGFYLDRLNTMLQLKAKQAAAASAGSHGAQESKNAGEDGDDNQAPPNLSADSKGNENSDHTELQIATYVAASDVAEVQGPGWGDEQESADQCRGGAPEGHQPAPASECVGGLWEHVPQEEDKKADEEETEQQEKAALELPDELNEPQVDTEEGDLKGAGHSPGPIHSVREPRSDSEPSEGLSPEAAAAAVAAVTRRGRGRVRDIFSDFGLVSERGFSHWGISGDMHDSTPEDAVPLLNNEKVGLFQQTDAIAVSSPLLKGGQEPDLPESGAVGIDQCQRRRDSSVSLDTLISKKVEKCPSTSMMEERGKRPGLTVESVTSVVFAALSRGNDADIADKAKVKAKEDLTSGGLERGKDAEKGQTGIRDSEMGEEGCIPDGRVVVSCLQTPQSLTWESDTHPAEPTKGNDGVWTFAQGEKEDEGGLSADEVAALVSAVTGRNRKRTAFMRDDSPKKLNVLFPIDSSDGVGTGNSMFSRRRGNRTSHDNVRDSVAVRGVSDGASPSTSTKVPEIGHDVPGISVMECVKKAERTAALAGEEFTTVLPQSSGSLKEQTLLAEWEKDEATRASEGLSRISEKEKSLEPSPLSQHCEQQDDKQAHSDQVDAEMEDMESGSMKSSERETTPLSAGEIPVAAKQRAGGSGSKAGIDAGEELPCVSFLPVSAAELATASPTGHRSTTAETSAEVPRACTPSASDSACPEGTSSFPQWSNIWAVELKSTTEDVPERKDRGTLHADDIISSVMSSLRVQVLRKVCAEADVDQCNAQAIGQLSGVEGSLSASHQDSDSELQREMNLEGSEEAKDGSVERSSRSLMEEATAKEARLGDDLSGPKDEGTSEMLKGTVMAQTASERGSQGGLDSSSPVEQRAASGVVLEGPVHSADGSREPSFGRVPVARGISPASVGQANTRPFDVLDHDPSDTSRGKVVSARAAHASPEPSPPEGSLGRVPVALVISPVSIDPANTRMSGLTGSEDALGHLPCCTSRGKALAPVSPGPSPKVFLGGVPVAREISPASIGQANTGMSSGGDDARDLVLSDTSIGKALAEGAHASPAPIPKAFIMLATAKAREAAVAVAGEADSADVGMSAQEKRKAERLKRAKAFAAMLKSGLEKAAAASAEQDNSAGLASNVLQSSEKHGVGDSQVAGSGVTPLSRAGDQRDTSRSCSRIENPAERVSSERATASAERDLLALEEVQKAKSDRSRSPGRREEFCSSPEQCYRNLPSDEGHEAGVERDTAGAQWREGSSTRDEIKKNEIQRAPDRGRTKENVIEAGLVTATGNELQKDLRIQEEEERRSVAEAAKEVRRKSLHDEGVKLRDQQTGTAKDVEREGKREQDKQKEKANGIDVAREEHDREREEGIRQKGRREHDKQKEEVKGKDVAREEDDSQREDDIREKGKREHNKQKEEVKGKYVAREEDDRAWERRKKRERREDLARSPGRKRSRHQRRGDDSGSDHTLDIERRRRHKDRKREAEKQPFSDESEDDDVSVGRDGWHRHKDRKKYSTDDISLDRDTRHRHKDRMRDSRHHPSGQGVRLKASVEKERGKRSGSKLEGRR
ncbi:hypothetical protein CBR_g49368 [Chara braunii]|uniref:Reverse transcriptase domain-containing protein n=1 Tax=Chara braunii TaxID=69332 RepID=A0A388M526_CHABU|nr:hypothetical protein CBR_g49368 [Chara braunii]|eukprot:GBG89579.1 hypothetical protein CBR_g49368 [Chara braunii]